MTRDDINAFADDFFPDEDIVAADGLDEAFLGIAGDMEPPVSVYSSNKCVDIFVGQGMTRDEAVEYFQYNVMGALGEGYPLFIETPE